MCMKCGSSVEFEAPHGVSRWSGLALLDKLPRLAMVEVNYFQCRVQDTAVRLHPRARNEGPGGKEAHTHDRWRSETCLGNSLRRQQRRQCFEVHVTTSQHDGGRVWVASKKAQTVDCAVVACRSMYSHTGNRPDDRPSACQPASKDLPFGLSSARPRRLIESE